MESVQLRYYRMSNNTLYKHDIKLALMASVMVLTSCTNTGHDNMEP